MRNIHKQVKVLKEKIKFIQTTQNLVYSCRQKIEALTDQQCKFGSITS